MFSTNSFFGVLVVIVTVMSSVATGAVLYALWVRRAARKRMPIPKEWPLNPRLLANTEERRVWSWLSKVFYNHHVMVKIPLTRFTLPRQPTQGQHWYNLLSGVYCTLTVCGQDGRVIGCVDVLGPNGLSRSNWRLKRTLLSQCAMAYLVIEPGSLLTTAKIRTLFLGEEAGLNYARGRERDEAMITAARLKLSAALEAQRRSRSSDPGRARVNRSNYGSAPDSLFPGESGFGSSKSFAASSDFGKEWQKNSFLAPLDSRRGDIPG